MPIFSKPNATLYAKKQTGKGAAAALSGANAVDFRRDSPLIWPKGEMIDRGLNRAGRFPSAKFIAGQWGEGGVNHELRGSGAAGTPPSGLSPFLETLFGSELTNTAGTVEAGSGAVGGLSANWCGWRSEAGMRCGASRTRPARGRSTPTPYSAISARRLPMRR